MRVKELIEVFGGAYTIATENSAYNSESAIPGELMDSIVKTIKIDKNRIMIMLEGHNKVQTLEELGYSFEVGV